MNRLLASFSLLLLAPSLAWALESDREQPIHIRASQVELDEPTGISTYIGDVVLRQGTMVLEAARLKVYTSDGELQRVEAEGSPAQFRQRPDNSEVDVRGEARHIEYHSDDGLAILTGDGHVWKGRDEFAGEHIVYDTLRSVVQAKGGTEGDGRVHAIIYPKSEQQKPADAAAEASQ